MSLHHGIVLLLSVGLHHGGLVLHSGLVLHGGLVLHSHLVLHGLCCGSWSRSYCRRNHCYRNNRDYRGNSNNFHGFSFGTRLEALG